MKPFDWLRLGGMIANKWPDIDFAEVAIRKVSGTGIVRVPILRKELDLSSFEDLAKEIEFECEDIEMEKAIVEGHIIRVGYGPKSNQLMVNSTFLSLRDS